MKMNRIEYVSPFDHEVLIGYHYQQDKAKALVVILHGMAEHQKRYKALVDECVNAQCDVITIDHRGHGESLYQKKITGYFSDEDGWARNCADLKEMVNLVNTKELPIVLFGHSMGTLFARSYLKHYPKGIAAVYLSGSPDYNPIVKVAKTAAKVIALFNGKKSISKLLNDQVFKKFNDAIENPKTNLDWLSINEENVKTYIADPLCGFSFTTKAMEDLSDGLLDVYEIEEWTINNPKLPIHFVSGKEDPTHQPQGLEFAQKTLHRQGYKNVEIEYVEHARHEILNEVQAPKIREQFVKWIHEKIDF